MKIKEVNDEHILFDNGSKITFEYEQECCEKNYADFKQLETIATFLNFEEPLDFEFTEGSGFRFGNKPSKMFFVPCYSEQNGYYSSEIEIHYNGKIVLKFDCE